MKNSFNKMKNNPNSIAIINVLHLLSILSAGIIVILKSVWGINISMNILLIVAFLVICLSILKINISIHNKKLDD